MNEPLTQPTQEPQNGSAGLEVPGEPGVFWCARHRKTQTRLRCGRCETPICPKCTIYGPTGARCRNCASYRGSHMYQVKPPQLLLAFGASAVLGGIGAIVMQMGLFLLLLFAPAIGGILGPMITRLTGGKRGPVIASVAAAGVVVGVAAVWFLRYGAYLGAGSAVLSAIAFPSLLMLAFAVLAVAGVWYWLR